jgi:uracil-DNA glycosylase
MEHPDFFKLCKEWTDFFYEKEMEEMVDDIATNITTNSDSNKKIYPHPSHIFRCFYMTPFSKISIVILGQDPYHNGSATGLCFDVKRGNIIHSSLQNIYKELENEGSYPTKDGNLEHWASQGVLLLNSALTVREGEPESHIELWSLFFKRVLQKLSTKDHLVWILFGKKAAEYKPYIVHPGHTIIETAHPSSIDAFMGSGVFKKANEILLSRGIEKISW